MKKILFLCFLGLGLVACSNGQEQSEKDQDRQEQKQKQVENSQKTVDWYLANRDVMKKDLETCRGVALNNQEDWCAAAQQANRKIAADKVLEGAHHTTF